MRDKEREPVAWGIANQFARWATRNAVHDRRKEEEGGVDTSQCAVNARLDSICWDRVFDRSLGAIEPEDFEDWHAESVKKLVDGQPALSYGWAAKHIAIYLKVTCYLAGFGRDGLKNVIHPPFDGILLKAVIEPPLALQSVNKESPAGLLSSRAFSLYSTMAGRPNSALRQVLYLLACKVSSMVRFSTRELRSRPPAMVRLHQRARYESKSSDYRQGAYAGTRHVSAGSEGETRL